MIYLYAYDQDKAPDVRRSILHKGTLQEITPTQLVSISTTDNRTHISSK